MAAAMTSCALLRCKIASQTQRVAPRRLTVPAAKATHVCRASKLAEAEVSNSAKPDKKLKHQEAEEEEEEFEGDEGLTTSQVETLLSVLCEETEIAEIDLKMGGFKLRVRRNVGASAAATAAPAAAPAAPAAPAPVAAAPSPLASVGPAYESEEEEDGSVMPILANKVGILRRGRYVKGKQVGKGPVVNPGDKVKKGQVIAFVEQLGTHWPVEAQQAGELVEFLLEEGDPVEYNEAVAEMAPYFGYTAGYKG